MPDEETPLLRSEQLKSQGTQLKAQRTPLPWFQLSIVLFLQLAEPLTSQVIYPFAPQLIRDIGITEGDESRVGYYVGIMQSLFFLTQAFTVLHWSSLSDIVGRRPVILTGLIGLSVSMYCFGMSTTFWGLVLSRCLNGALNGNIGVIKSIMAEITDSTNISQAYGYQPIAWSTGGVLGPMIGGALARPAEQFPSIFGGSSFLQKYPYFLPCAVPATFSAIAWLVTFFFLRETVEHPKPLAQHLGLRSSKEDTGAKAVRDKPPSLRSLLIAPVIIAGGNYACLSLVDIAYRAIQPLFFSTPVALGGLGMAPAEIGKILSFFGLANGVTQVFFFARIHDYLGPKRTFMLGIGSAAPTFALFPVMSYLAKTQGVGGWVGVVIVVQTLLSICLSFSYGSIFIYISGASPDRASLGATNGLCQMSVSVFRAIGPALANSLFSLSIQHHYMGGWMVYYVLLVVVAASLGAAALLPSKVQL
ncbi:member of major facilitator superfamily multidrug-resistance, DHA1 sub-family [Mycena floridula]|nr:member of major facilitator superfamily multidrug-resistance, DHA1 sub-family [Mycena floridula]